MTELRRAKLEMGAVGHHVELDETTHDGPVWFELLNLQGNEWTHVASYDGTKADPNKIIMTADEVMLYPGGMSRLTTRDRPESPEDPESSDDSSVTALIVVVS